MRQIFYNILHYITSPRCQYGNTDNDCNDWGNTRQVNVINDDLLLSGAPN